MLVDGPEQLVPRSMARTAVTAAARTDGASSHRGRRSFEAGAGAVPAAEVELLARTDGPEVDATAHH